MKRILLGGILTLFMIVNGHGETQTTVVAFDDGWQGWAGPTGNGGTSTIETEGGNPGAHARTVFNDFGITFRTDSNPAFIGDFTAYEEVTVSIDVKVEDISILGNPVPRNLLVDFRSTSLAVDDYPWTSVWYVLTEMNSGDDWATYEITFDPNATELPDGWGGYGAEDPDTFAPVLPEGVTFADVMANTEILAFTTLEPGFFYTFTDHDVRIDNISISTHSAQEPPDDRLVLTDIRGGDLTAAPVASGTYAYVASGVLILSYDYTDTENPQLVASSTAQPAHGPITALAMHEDYLYASWSRPDGTGGLNIYSLIDPAAPELVAVVDDYYPDAFANIPRALAVVGDYLYMNDTENGVFIASLDNPVELDFQHAIQEFNGFSRFFVTGNLLAASGRNFLGDTVLGIYDVSDPAAPVAAGTALASGNTSFQFDIAGTLAVGAGTHLEIYDFSDPEDIQLRSSVELSDPAPLSMIAGDYAYVGGFEDFQVWNISDPDAPVLETSGSVDSFGMHRAASTPFGPMILSRRDQVILLDTADPADPAVKSDAYIPGGYAAMDIGITDDLAYILQQDYGMTSHDTTAFDLVTQFETELPPLYQARALERLRVEGDYAYLASWGSGLVIADISDPANPTQTGLLEFPFITPLDVRDDLVFFGTSTNDGVFGIVDVSDPAAPTMVSTMATHRAYDLVVEGDHAFVATEGGMYIIDVSDTTQPVVRSQYDACDFTQGVAVESKRQLALLACSSGDLHIIDISDPDTPTQLAIYPSTDGFGEGHSVKVKGDLAVFSHREGVDLLDVSDPSAPAMIVRREISWPARNLVWHDNQVFAFTGPAGYYLFLIDPPEPPVEDEIFHDAFELVPKK